MSAVSFCTAFCFMLEATSARFPNGPSSKASAACCSSSTFNARVELVAAAALAAREAGSLIVSGLVEECMVERGGKRRRCRLSRGWRDRDKSLTSPRPEPATYRLQRDPGNAQHHQYGSLHMGLGSERQVHRSIPSPYRLSLILFLHSSYSGILRFQRSSAPD